MLYSGVIFKTAADMIRREVNIALPISDDMVCTHINTLEQFLYTDFVKEQKLAEIPTGGQQIINLGLIVPAIDERAPVYEDIMKVYGHALGSRVEYTKGSMTAGRLFSKPLYWKDGVNLAFNTMLNTAPETVEIIYYARPKLKTPANMTTLEIMIPVEFMPMVYAYLRCEMYKLAVNVTSSGQWADEYNAWLGTFTQWIVNRNKYFGEG